MKKDEKFMEEKIKFAHLIFYNNRGTILKKINLPFRFCWGDKPKCFEISLNELNCLKDDSLNSIILFDLKDVNNLISLAEKDEKKK